MLDIMHDRFTPAALAAVIAAHNERCPPTMMGPSRIVRQDSRMSCGSHAAKEDQMRLFHKLWQHGHLFALTNAYGSEHGTITVRPLTQYGVDKETRIPYTHSQLRDFLAMEGIFTEASLVMSLAFPGAEPCGFDDLPLSLRKFVITLVQNMDN